MSILSWLFKPKKEMAKPNTKYVRIGKYKITKHAQNRVVDPTRNLCKLDMLDNLLTKPNVITKTKKDKYGRLSYDRIGKKVTTYINPLNNNVASIRVISNAEEKKHNLIINKRGKYYVKKNKWQYATINLKGTTNGIRHIFTNY